MKLRFVKLQSLNTKFSGEISSVSHRSFPDEYFTCQSRCSACEGRCTKPMNHEDGSNGVGHQTQSMCVYQKDQNIVKAESNKVWNIYGLSVDILKQVKTGVFIYFLKSFIQNVVVQRVCCLGTTMQMTYKLIMVGVAVCIAS